MTDHLTENARLRAALEAMLHRHILYCGGESMAFAGHTDVALFQEARAALAAPAPDAVQEAARVPEIAALIAAADPIANWTIGGMLADDPENLEKYPNLAGAILDLRAALRAIASNPKG